MGSGRPKTRREEPVAERSIKNATVHGLYAKRLSPEEWMLLGETAAESLEGEIALQRALIGRLAGVLVEQWTGMER